MSTLTQEAPAGTITHISFGSPPPPRANGAGPFLSRGQILDATDACFAADGYDGTTIRAIAGRLGCAVGSIYRYFTDKRDLLLACARRMMLPVVESLDNENGAAFEESRRMYRDLATRHAELYRLQFWLAGTGVPPVVGEILDRWAGLLGDRQEAERCWALVHGGIMLGVEEKVSGTAAVPDTLSEPQPEDEPEDMTLL